MHTPSRIVVRAGVVAAACISLVAATFAPVLADAPGGLDGGTLDREPLVTPTDEAGAAPDDLQYADPTAGLSGIDPPEPNNSGGAQLSYPLVLPGGRGLTPELALEYDSGAASSWVGQGWSFGVGEVTVDTDFGVPKFCPRTTAPTCGNYESESYRLEGDLLMPNAITATPQPRVTDRRDFTRQVETEYEQIIRRGSNPKNYSWEVHDKAGNVRWYGGFPDAGGPIGAPGTRTGAARNDLAQDPGSILADDAGNGVTWHLKAERDIGYNLIRYEYDKVTYEAEKTKNGTRWAEEQGTCDGVCARHVYLSKIFYTGAAEDSGQDEDPAYEVRLIRGETRDDPVLDASGGVLDLDKELLTTIQVRYHKTDELITEYRLSYTKNRFGKTLLSSVRQVGCATGKCDDADASTDGPGATHTFEYFDDVADPAVGNGDGFGSSATWDTGSDGIADGEGGVEGNASALGTSSNIAGDGHVYIGFNPAKPTKLGSFGGALTFSGGDTRSMSEFIDINGDSLPDKVFRDPDTALDSQNSGDVYYRLNTSSPGQALTDEVTFGPAVEVANLDNFPVEHEFGVDGGVEAYFGVSVLFHAGGSWNWSDGYFNDVNGDGLPDYVKRGSVLYNHLDCSHDPCRPTFGASDALTRLPLDVRPTGAGSDSTLDDALAMLRRLSPPIDTVRRWIAPYAGTVTIDSTAVLVAPPGSSSNRLAIQKNGRELADRTLTSDGQTWSETLTDVPVAKGTKIYFRFSPDTKAQNSVVEWAPTVTYTSYANGQEPATVPTDENGLSQKVFDSGSDFTLAGRPGGFVGMPTGGSVRFTGRLEKDVTSDDVRPTITHRFGDPSKQEVDEPVTVTPLTPEGDADPTRQKTVSENATGQFCVTSGAGTSFGCHDTKAKAEASLQVITAGETGLFAVTADSFDVDAPTTGDDAHQDTVLVRLAVDSPVDPNALHWATVPSLCYLKGDACDPAKAQVTPPVDTDIYPAVSGSAPRSSWTSDRTGTVVARIDLSGTKNPAADVVFTAKEATAGGVSRTVAKKQIHVVKDALIGGRRAFVEVPITKGDKYWFDVSTTDPSLSEAVSKVDVRLGTRVVLDVWHEFADVPQRFNAAGRQGYFALPHRGWAIAGYRGDGSRRTNAIDEEKFVLADADGTGYDDRDDACKAINGTTCLTKSDTDSMTFPGDYESSGPPKFDESAAAAQIKEVYAFLPTRTANGSAVEESWTGPRPDIAGTANGLGAGLLGDAIPEVTSSSGSVPAPILTGSAGPVFSLTGGIGPLTGSFAFGWSKSDVDYLDMNGDGFPDLVSPDTITFTDPRGGMACRQSETTFAACKGGGPETVNTDTNFAFSAGFNGSPVNVKVNSRGVPNATQGGSASKGGGSSKDEYGASVGAGAEIAGSFSSPNSADPSWDDSGFEADLDKIPGEPLTTTSDAPLQQTLADVNGDGLPDKVKVTPKGVLVKLNLGYEFAGEYVFWADGGFEAGESFSGALALGIGFSGYNKDFSGGISRNASVDFPRYSWSDVNGDGILDALHKSDGDVTVSFGTGTGLNRGTAYGDTQRVPFEVVGGGVTAQTGNQARQDKSVGYGGGFDFTIGFGPLCAPVPACYLIVNPGAHTEGAVSVTDVDLQDVNGDGYADSVRRDPDKQDQEIDVRLNTHGRTGLLKSVVNPLGGRMHLDYARDGNTVTHPGSVWVLEKLSIDDGRSGDGPDVATSTFTYSGLKYDFVHRAGLGYESVTERELAENGSTVLRTTRQQFANDHLFEAGLPTEVALYDGDVDPSNLVQKNVSTWRVLDGATGQPITGDDVEAMSTDKVLATWTTPQLMRTTETWFGADGATEALVSQTEYAYDALGNPVRIEDQGDPDTDSDDVVSAIAYSTCPDSAGEYTVDHCGKGDPAEHPVYWNDQLCPSWVSLPAMITVTDADGTVLRHREGPKSLCDNASVTLLRELISGEPDSGTYAETRLAYDAWGSYDRIVYPEGENGLSYSVQYVRDEQRHADVAKVTDYELDEAEAKDFLDEQKLTIAPEHVGLTSLATFDPLSGEVATRTDANGNTTTYEHDALGRLAKVTMPDGGWVSYDYRPNASGYAYAVAHHSDRFHPGNTIDTVTFVDGIGRTTQQKREASLFQGPGQPTKNGFIVAGAVEYDVLGREVEQWHPIVGDLAGAEIYDTRTSDTESTKYTYDVLDRVLTETAPNGSVTTTAYGFGKVGGLRVGTTTVTDPLGRATVTHTDPRGFTHAVDDIAVGRAPLRTSYDVDPLGQLLEASSAGRVQVANTYDLLGHRTVTSTQDGGRVEYAYDAAGNRVSSQSSVQRDSGDTTRFAYSFGNLVGVTYTDSTPDVTLRWGGYGGAPTGENGAGRLVEVTDAARHQILGYDVNGFPASEKTEMQDDHWKLGLVETTWSYDWLGRIATVGQFDGETLTYDYDLGGSLEHVAGKKDCTDLGVLTAAVDELATTITVTENPTDGPPPVPFTITVDGEQMRVTDRVAAGVAGQFTYTVERGINGTAEAPTAAAHAVGAGVSTDETVVCNYRYLDDRQYDQFAQTAFEQVGNGNRTAYTRDAETRRLTRMRTIAPAVGDRELQDLNYSYDRVGNVLTYENRLPADTSALMGGPSEQRYEYDPYYRVTHAEGAWHQAPHVLRKYTYDLSYDDDTGNVLSKAQKDWRVKEGCTDTCKEFVFDETTFDLGAFAYSSTEQHRVTDIGSGGSAQRLTYDLDGNVTSIATPDHLREMSWDSNGKMTMVVDRPNGTGGKPTYYTYDWQGERAIEDKETGRTWYVNPWLTVRDHTFWKNVIAEGRMLATKFVEEDDYEGKYYFMHPDLQGSTNIVTDRTGEIFQHHEYLPSGAVWVDEKSTVFRTPYQFAGEYFDEDHLIADLGQRWYDQRRSMLYGVDQAVFNDPTALVEEPTLAGAYTFARSNPLSWTDPDGNRATRVNPVKVKALQSTLRNDDGTPLSLGQRIRLKQYFDEHTGLGGKIAFGVLSRLERHRKLQEFAEKFEMKPLLEFSVARTDKGYELQSIKASWGYGKRAKLDFSRDTPGATTPPPQPAANVPAPPPPPPANWRPNRNPPGQQPAAPSLGSAAAPTKSNGG